jgi:hypothetical protein
MPTPNTPQIAPQGSKFAVNGVPGSRMLSARVFVRHGEIKVTQYYDFTYGLHVQINRPDKVVFSRLIFAADDDQRDELLSFIRGMAKLIE